MRNKELLSKAKQKIVNNILSNITLGEITVLILEKAENRAEEQLAKMNEAEIKHYLGIVTRKPKTVLSKRGGDKEIKPKEKEGFLTNFKNKIINLFKKEKPQEPAPKKKKKSASPKGKPQNKRAVLSKIKQK